MKTVKITFGAVLCLSCLLSSCTQRMMDFTLISSKNIDFSKAGTFVRSKNRVTGEDKVHWIVIVPTGKPDVKRAIDKAIESTPGCVALMDGVVYSKFWLIPYIYGKQTLLVEGVPVIDPSLACQAEPTSHFNQIALDKHENVIKISPIAEADYTATKAKIVKQALTTAFAHSQQVR